MTKEKIVVQAADAVASALVTKEERKRQKKALKKALKKAQQKAGGTAAADGVVVAAEGRKEGGEQDGGSMKKKTKKDKKDRKRKAEQEATGEEAPVVANDNSDGVSESKVSKKTSVFSRVTSVSQYIVHVLRIGGVKTVPSRHTLVVLFTDVTVTKTAYKIFTYANFSTLLTKKSLYTTVTKCLMYMDSLTLQAPGAASEQK